MVAPIPTVRIPVRESPMDRASETTVARLLPMPAGVAWVPAVLLLGMILFSFATGHGPVPTGQAATVGVQASLPANIYVDATNCAPASLAIGDLVPGTDPWKTAQDASGQTCSIDFGTTNNNAGTTLSMLEDPAAPASPTDAMKCVGGGCSTDALADYDNAAEPAAGTSAFGAQLLSASGLATAAWAVAPAVNDVQDAASTTCTTVAVGTGTCAFTWGATAATSDLPGAYQAQAQLVVLAN